jgi:hypothetical protein
MTSNWALPRTVTQYVEQGAEDAHVSWIDRNNFHSLKNLDGKFIQTSRDLLHIARAPRNSILEKTYYLKITNFDFENLPTTLTGIELRLSMNRSGRITDDTVQLCLNDAEIGINLANLNLDPKKIYGGETILWDTALSISDIATPSFGIILRFKSHPNWPHRCSPLIDAVELRIH